jgi:hypothetical protein
MFHWYKTRAPAASTMNEEDFMRFTRFALLGVLLALPFAVLYARPDDAAADNLPHYTKDGKLLRPANYRDWVFLSSGFDMNYSPQGGGDHHMFTNVFVPQAAYKEFLAGGKWPDKTIWVVEERMAGTHVNPARQGQFQTEDTMGLGVEVKDASQPNVWNYYGFDAKDESADAVPKGACFSCHEKNGAVEHTFVQFYPTLKPAARKFGVYRVTAEALQTEATVDEPLTLARSKPASGAQGDWAGFIPHYNLHVVFHLGANGVATVDSADQKQYGTAATYTVAGNQVNIHVPSARADYKGTFSGEQMQGTITFPQ